MGGKHRKVAYCVTPHTGGTFRFFLNLREALAGYGWDVRSITVGAMERRGWYEPKLVTEGCELIAPEIDDLGRASHYFLEWLEENEVEIVFPMCSAVAWAAIPFLPERCRVVTRVSASSRWALRLATSDADKLDAVVAMTTAHLRLVEKMAPELQSRLYLIPQGVNTRLFSPQSVFLGDSRPLRAIYLGRLSIFDKGVDLLPEIVKAVVISYPQFQLTVMGAGSAYQYLQKRVLNLGVQQHVKFLPACSPLDVPTHLRDHDLFILPSRFEGSPNSLLEAMACGLVPVASYLPGITDFVIDQWHNGVLCDPPTPHKFAEAILELASNERLRHKLKQGAITSIQKKHSMDVVAKQWVELFEQVTHQPAHRPIRWPVKPEEIRPHSLFPKRRFVKFRRWIRGVLAKLRRWSPYTP
jgi:glycosyltransferase involved in cell wall biosynthesis